MRTYTMTRLPRPTDCRPDHRPSAIGRAALIGSLALALSGCNNSVGVPGEAAPIPASVRHPKPDTGLCLLAGLDDSAGFEPHLGETADLAARLSGELAPDTDRLTLIRVNSDAAVFFNDEAPPDSRMTLDALLARTLSTRPARGGTRPSLFFQIAARKAVAEGCPCVVVFLSDADQDFSSPREEALLRGLGKALAGCGNVRAVVFCGATPENQGAWERRFAELNASRRLHFEVLDRTALDRISEYMTAARQPSAGGGDKP